MNLHAHVNSALLPEEYVAMQVLPKEQGRSTKIIQVVKRTRTSRLSLTNSFSLPETRPHGGLRPSYQKPTCHHAINLKALCAVNLVTPPPLIGGARNTRFPPSGKHFSLGLECGPFLTPPYLFSLTNLLPLGSFLCARWRIRTADPESEGWSS